MAEEETLYGLGTQKELVKKMLGKPIAKSHDLTGEMLTELSDAIINGIEAFTTFPNMPELASKNIKETLDKRYGPAWHVVIGEGYAYDISVQSGAYLLMYYNGVMGCLVFKT
jgi:dynein light chain 4